ncbi:hypothetical protein J4Q44_G00318140 [Coregonus suidteri]|uniref:Uncharacterized protein n=1 Tax=Coregonus suidteri TaxID=861788 RepID=A0AAN8QFN6_9TELE
MWEEKTGQKERTRLYAPLPTAPPPYDDHSKTMAPVLDIAGKVHYQQRTDKEKNGIETTTPKCGTFIFVFLQRCSGGEEK